MNKIIKRGAVVAMATILAIGASGCQKKEESGIVELTYYASNNPQQEDEKVIAKVNEYLEEKIGVRVNWTNIPPGEYAKKTGMLFATNEKFDVCFVASGCNFAENVKNGVFLPLDELLKNEGKEIYEMTPDYFLDAATIDGEIYALPHLKDVGEHWAIGCRTKFLKKNNIDVSNITKLEELTPVFQTIKDNEPGVYPVLMRGNNTFFRFLPFEQITGSSVGAFKTDDFDKVINQYDTDEAKAFFKLMREWYLKGFIRSDAATATNDSDIQATKNFFAQYIGYLPTTELNIGKSEEDHFTYIMGLNNNHLRTGNVLGAGFAISSNSDHPEKAMEFINLVNTDSYLRNLINLGIEGEHWIAVGENQWKLPEGVKEKADTGYSPTEYTLGNRFILRVREDIPENKWELFEKFNNDAEKYPTLGFVFEHSSLSTEIAAVNSVYQEYAPALMVGAVDPDEYLPKFLKELELAGSEKIIAEIQRQYDEWKQNK